MIIPRQSIIYCHPQEFCVSAGGDKVIVKAYFKFTDLFLLVVKCIYFVLLKFKDNSFAFSHLFKVLKTMLLFLSKSLGSEWATRILVSSAKITGAEVLFIILGKAFIYSRKSRGPKMYQLYCYMTVA